MKYIVFLISLTISFYNVIALFIPNYEYTKPEEIDFLIGDVQGGNFERAIFEYLQISTDNNEYWLFTRQNPTIPQIIVIGDENSLRASNYDSSKPLKVIAHGWTRDGNSPVNTMITAAYLEVSDVNVIVLDWRIDASGDYFSASIRVPATGRYLGNFLQWLISTGGGSWDSVHLIGYSLGAHLVGNAGREIGGLAKRVTGLDPAGPFWSNSFSLNTESGQYVEAIHTNILFQGITEPIAHADFYPNGGRNQPGCDSSTCDHARSYEFFASSVRTNHLIGRQCIGLWQALLNLCYGNILDMGNGNLNKTGNGIYALSTGSSWPY